MSGVIAVVGATAVGKSDFAVRLAQEDRGAEIVNADSMQVYRGMDIGTAKLAPGDRGGVQHHLLDVWPVTTTATLVEYQRLALDAVADITDRGRTPIVVGGSGMYVHAVIDRWDIPGTDPQIRAALEAELATSGVDVLHARLAECDPAAALAILPTNGRRIVRALEVVELTGRPFAASAPQIGAPRWDALIVGLDWDTERLDERLARRTAKIFDDGLVDEVRRLLGTGLRQGITAPRALGYAQVITALDAGGGSEALAAAREQTFVGTRRYVRRQRSWFRRDHRIRWLGGAEDGNVDATLRAWRHVS